MLQAIDSKGEGALVLAQPIPPELLHCPFPSLSWRAHQLDMDPKISCEPSLTLKNADEERSLQFFFQTIMILTTAALIPMLVTATSFDLYLLKCIMG